MAETTIYDERLDPVYGVGHRSVSKVTPPHISTKYEGTEKSQNPSVGIQTKKVWSGPIVSREKLVETLNMMEPERYVILTILTISVGQVQIICYQDVEL